MKIIKKLSAFLFVIVICAALCAPAFASETDSTTVEDEIMLISDTSESSYETDPTATTSSGQTGTTDAAQSAIDTQSTVTPTPSASQTITPIGTTSSKISVSAFNFDYVTETRYRLSWTIQNCPTNVYVRLYVTTAASGELSGTELGAMETGANGMMYVDLPDMDCGYYHFAIQVIPTDSDAIFAYSSESFFHTNSDRAEELTGVIAGMENGKVYALWDGGEPAEIYVYDADTKGLISSAAYTVSPAEIKIPSDVKNVEVGVASYSYSSGRFTPIACSEVKSSTVNVTYPEGDVTTDALMPIKIEAPNRTIKVFVNGKEDTADEKVGDANIALSEGENQVCVFMTDSKGSTIVRSKNITLDTIPPAITLIDDLTEYTTTDDAIYIKGSVEEDAELLCDGTEASKVGEYFCIRKSLNIGMNTIRLSAKDAAGNESSYVMKITRTFWTSENKLMIPIAVAALIILVFEIYMLFIRGRGKNKQ